MYPSHAGKVVPEKDAVLFFSNGGNTPECVAAAHHLLSRGVCTLAITGSKGECMQRHNILYIYILTPPRSASCYMRDAGTMQLAHGHSYDECKCSCASCMLLLQWHIFNEIFPGTS